MENNNDSADDNGKSQSFVVSPTNRSNSQPHYETDKDFLKNLQLNPKLANFQSHIEGQYFSDEFYAEQERMQESVQEGARKRYQRNQEQTQREKENNEEIKNIGKLIAAIEQSNAKNDKLSTRMFWLTVATVILAAVQIAIAVITAAGAK